jgi:hypothetical protein
MLGKIGSETGPWFSASKTKVDTSNPSHKKAKKHIGMPKSSFVLKTVL